MKKIIVVVVVFLVCAVANAQVHTEKAIFQTVEQFNGYLKAKNTPMAWGMLSSSSKVYFNQILAWAKTANKATVQNLPLLEKFFVLSLRHNTTPAELKNASSYKVMQALTESKGMTMPSFTATGMKAVFNGKQAYLTPAAEKNSLIQLPFTWEDNAWKLDFAGAMKHTTAVFGKAMGSGAQTDALVLQLLKQSTAKAPASTIWDPVM